MTPSGLDHDRIEELIAADSLGAFGAVSEADELADLMRAHGPDCAECRRLVRDYAEVSVGLAIALDPEPLSSGAEERLLAAARLTNQVRDPDARAGGAEPAGKDSSISRVGRRRPPGFRPSPWLVAAAAAIALIAGAIGYSVAPRPAPAVTAQQAAFVRFASEAGTRFVTLKGTGRGTVTVAYRPGGQRGWVLGNDLPNPPGDKVYELWSIAGPGHMPQAAGLFAPAGGNVLHPTAIKGPFTTLAVTIEPNSGSSEPTSPPLYIGTSA